MDNFSIDVTSDGDLMPTMGLAFRGGTAHGYAIVPDKGLVFFGSYVDDAPKEYVRSPFPMNATFAAEFAKLWLKTAHYGAAPDHDGDSEQGWRIYTESWGHVGPWRGSICAVKPAWALYGK